MLYIFTFTLDKLNLVTDLLILNVILASSRFFIKYVVLSGALAS